MLGLKRQALDVPLNHRVLGFKIFAVDSLLASV